MTTEQIDPQDEVRHHPAVLYGPSFDFVIEQRGQDYEAAANRIAQDHADLRMCDVVRFEIISAFEQAWRLNHQWVQDFEQPIVDAVKPKPITALSLRAARVKRLLTAGLR